MKINKSKINKKFGSNLAVVTVARVQKKTKFVYRLRSPEATSIGRASGFNEPVVKEYFNNFANVLNKHHFNADRIFNIDETGVTTVQNPKKVVTPTGMKNVGAITSADEGSW